MDFHDHAEILNNIKNFLVLHAMEFVLQIRVNGGVILHADLVEIDVIDIVHLSNFVVLVENRFVGFELEVSEVENPALGIDIVVLVKR